MNKKKHNKQMSSIKALSASQLDFVENKVTKDFIKDFGTSTGFNEFCKVALKAGAIKSCGNGAQKNKFAYATYLYNANIWNEMLNKYQALDAFTKAGMAKQVQKGKGLHPGLQTDLEKGRVVGSCLTGGYTVPQLKEMVLELKPDLKYKDLDGMVKSELCALVDGLLGGNEGAMTYWDLGTKKGGTIPWKDYKFKPKEMQSGQVLEKQYLKELGLGPKDKSGITLDDLLQGKYSGMLTKDEISKLQKQAQ